MSSSWSRAPVIVAAFVLVLACAGAARADIAPMGPDGGPPTDAQMAAYREQKSKWWSEMQAAKAKRRGCQGREALLGGVAGGALVLAASAMRRRRRAATT